MAAPSTSSTLFQVIDSRTNMMREIAAENRTVVQNERDARLAELARTDPEAAARERARMRPSFMPPQRNWGVDMPLDSLAVSGTAANANANTNANAAAHTTAAAAAAAAFSNEGSVISSPPSVTFAPDTKGEGQRHSTYSAFSSSSSSSSSSTSTVTTSAEQRRVLDELVATVSAQPPASLENAQASVGAVHRIAASLGFSLTPPQTQVQYPAAAWT